MCPDTFKENPSTETWTAIKCSYELYEIRTQTDPITVKFTAAAITAATDDNSDFSANLAADPDCVLGTKDAGNVQTITCTYKADADDWKATHWWADDAATVDDLVFTQIPCTTNSTSVTLGLSTLAIASLF